jgi:hypothetical protein
MPPEMSDLAGIAERLPWPRMAAPLATAEDALALPDERLRTSPIREGFIARAHFLDACASLWLEGELVHLEDLVLHDAEKDARSPTNAALVHNLRSGGSGGPPGGFRRAFERRACRERSRG